MEQLRTDVKATTRASSGPLQAGAVDPAAAFGAARAQQQKLKDMPVRERLRYVSALKRVILAARESIMDRIQADTGKCRSDALMSEIFPVLDHLAYLEKFAPKTLGDRKVHTPLALMGKSSKVYFEPLGTALVISPWNYPFYQAIVPCTSAFVAGNATVYKPSEHTPLKGLVEDVLSKAGFHPDWIKVVYGDAQTGAALIDQRPEKIFFTGSVGTGRKIMAQAARHLIPVELELGGKDPMIVFEDVNLERAAAGALWGAMTNAGQSCTSVERLYVHESIYEKFKTELARQAAKLRVGVDKDGDADFGKMTVGFQVKTVAEHLEEAKRGGARLLTGSNWDGANALVPPLVLENVKESMKIVREETFGPALPLIPFKTEEEAIRLANDSEYGLSASVWSADLKRAERVARALVTGNVSINNVMLTEGNHALPFGGVKNSGFGRYKGEFGLYAFSNVKSVLFDKNSSKIEANWYPYTREKYGLFTRMMVALFSGGVLGFIRFAIAGLKLESYSSKHRL
jgi:aldehyde dehydrogenase (NAD+)